MFVVQGKSVLLWECREIKLTKTPPCLTKSHDEPRLVSDYIPGITIRVLKAKSPVYISYFMTERLLVIGKFLQISLFISSRFYENQPHEICSHLSEKASKRAGFLGPRSSKITLTKEKERRKRKRGKEERKRREKSNGCTLSFYNGFIWR